MLMLVISIPVCLCPQAV